MARRIRINWLILMGLAVLVAGCASRPIIDTTGVDMARYRADLAECEQVAKQVQTGTTVAKSSVVGTAVGAAVGAITGGAGEGAAAGAVSGGAAGAVEADREESTVVKNCLRHRGYVVLN